MLHHHLSKDGSEADLQKAKDFYIKSFSWSKIERIDNKLYKRALKDLKNLSLNFGVEIEKDVIERQLQKFYIKERSI